MIEHLSFNPSPRNLGIPLLLVAIGAGAAVYGLSLHAEETWPCLLLNGFYVTSLTVSAIFFMASQRLAGARWSASLRRIPEALVMAMPIAAILMMAVYFGRETLFVW